MHYTVVPNTIMIYNSKDEYHKSANLEPITGIYHYGAGVFSESESQRL